MNNKFQNLTVDFSQLRSIPIQERVALAGSPLGNSIFGNMSPTEIARLFPKYYQDTIPAIGGLAGAVSGGTNMGGDRRSNVAPVESVPLTLAQRIAQSAAEKRIGAGGNAVPSKNASEIQRGIIQLANKYGMNPVDVATFIRYETAGSMDPYKKGPTTKWGTHRGLIQMGDVQQRQYGINLDPNKGDVSSVEEQFVAVGKYFDDVGFGKWLADNPNATVHQKRLAMYASVNAGSPKKIHASDANNGGAPGDVSDKVADMYSENDNSHYAFAKQYMSQSYDVVDPTENTHIQEGTDAGATPLATDGENETTTGPEQEPFKITPETIATYNDLNPRIEQYANTLPDDQKQKFYDDLTTLGSVNEINTRFDEHTRDIGDINKKKTQNSAEAMVNGDMPLNQAVMNKALQINGLDEVQDRNRIMSYLRDGGVDLDPQETAWCAAVVNSTLKQTGIEGSGSQVATSFGEWGNAIPAEEVQSGDVLVEMRGLVPGATGGHVGFATGNTRTNPRTGEIEYEMYGGNQGGPGGGSRYANTKYIPASKFVARRAPAIQTQMDYEKANPRPNTHIQEDENSNLVTDAAPSPVATDTNQTNATTEPPAEQLIQEQPALPTPTPEAVPEAATAPPEPVPVPETAPEQPTAVPEQAAEVPAQQMAQGGYIDQKDNLQVVDKTSGDVKAEINNGELQDGIDAKGGGLQVKSNVTRKADDLIQKYDDQTNVDSPTDPAAKKARPEERDPVQGGMSSPIQNSQAASHIGNIPGTNAFNEIHASLHRAYGLSRDRMNYGNVS